MQIYRAVVHNSKGRSNHITVEYEDKHLSQSERACSCRLTFDSLTRFLYHRDCISGGFLRLHLQSEPYVRVFAAPGLRQQYPPATSFFSFEWTLTKVDSLSLLRNYVSFLHSNFNHSDTTNHTNKAITSGRSLIYAQKGNFSTKFGNSPSRLEYIHGWMIDWLHNGYTSRYNNKGDTLVETR